MELTDADLLARVLVDGDQHAFGELVRRHQSPVRGLLRQLTRADVELADDLAQETFIRAYKNIRSFRGEAKFSTWLYRIAYNVFRDQARKRKELVGIDEAQWQSQADPQTADPGLRHDLMNALNSLLTPIARAQRHCPLLSKRSVPRRSGPGPRDSARDGQNERLART